MNANLRLVDSDGVVHEVDRHTTDLEEQIIGLTKTITSQARMIGALEKRVQHDEDPNSHPKGKEIVELIERWKRGTGHVKAKVSADRIVFVKARIKDGYEIASEEWLPNVPTLELAVDGIAACPFVVNGQRQREGTESQRHDRLGICLGGGEKVEEFARLGYRARKQGLVTWEEA